LLELITRQLIPFPTSCGLKPLYNGRCGFDGDAMMGGLMKDSVG
jgi:hypothetical protein